MIRGTMKKLLLHLVGNFFFEDFLDTPRVSSRIIYIRKSNAIFELRI